MSNGLSFKQAKKIEIESWDPEIINILVNKLSTFGVIFNINELCFFIKSYPFILSIFIL